MSKNQKFKKGDMVYVAKDLCPSMSHFRNDTMAIVVGSYDDLCLQDGLKLEIIDLRTGEKMDDPEPSYEIMFCDSRETCAWYDEKYLTLLV